MTQVFEAVPLVLPENVPFLRGAWSANPELERMAPSFEAIAYGIAALTGQLPPRPIA